MEQKRDKYMQRWTALETERSSFINTWRDISDYMLPRGSRFLTTNANDGRRKDQKIVNPTPTLAVRTLSSGMMAGITSPARPWFKLTIPDMEVAEQSPVRIWLDDVTRRMNSVFARSNLYQALPVVYSQLGCFSVAALFVEQDDDEVIRCTPFPIGSYCVAQSDKGDVDTFYRKFRMTTGQLVEKFGLEACSQGVQSEYKSGQLDAWHDVMHIIEPRRERDPRSRSSTDMPWRSAYMECGHDQFLREAGYAEFPVMVPRWEANGEDVYGSNSPGWAALGDTKSLMLKERRGQEMLDKGARPPMNVPSEMKNSPISLLPGGVNYVDMANQGKGMAPAYEPNPNWYQFLTQEIREVENRIERSFYVDLFLMLANSDRRQITAREIEERYEEKMLMLGPVLQRLNDELLDPLIDRTFNIMVRASEPIWAGRVGGNPLLPEPPEEMEGMDIKVEYVSIMAQAQKSADITSIERFAGFAGSLAAVNPESLDKVNFDVMLEEWGDRAGVPARALNDDKEVAAVRQQRAQQQQAQAMLQMANEGAQGAKTLSEAEVSNDNMLRRMVGQ